MKIENLKVKENISFDDKVMAVDYIVGRLFEFDEDGFVSDYAPYYMEPAQVEAIVTFFMEGISFEDGETIYDSAIQNEEVNVMIDSFFVNSKRKTTLSYQQQVMRFVMECVAEKLQFMKQLYLNRILTRRDSLGEFLDRLSKKIDELDVTKFNAIDMNAMNQFMNTVSSTNGDVEKIAKAYVQELRKESSDSRDKTMDAIKSGKGLAPLSDDNVVGSQPGIIRE